MNVPMTGIVYDPKIRGFMEYMNQRRYVEIESFDDEKFYSMVLESGKNSEAMRKELETESVPLREKAKESGVKLWMVAEALGMADSAFSRKLRHELAANEREQVLSVIEQLAAGSAEVA